MQGFAPAKSARKAMKMMTIVTNRPAVTVILV
jgi:hypothetical protein